MKLKHLQNTDVIFLSCFDHNEGKNSHGLFQMFEFFNNNLKINSVFVTTYNSAFRNNTNVFDISSVGAPLTLAHQINSTYISRTKKDENSWLNMMSYEEYKQEASKKLIEVLPKHRFVVLADKADIDLNVLEKVMHHFGSKVLFISACNDTWTGYCAYPEEFNCDKFRTPDGCHAPCPAMKSKAEIHSKNYIDDESLIRAFKTTNDFVKRNLDSVYLNVGNSFSFKESGESHIFKDVKKFLIPLKNVHPIGQFKDVWKFKAEQRKKLFEILKKGNKNSLLDKTKFVVFWAAHDISLKRKGIEYFINSIQILKNLIKFNRYEEVLLIIAGQASDKELANSIQSLGVPVLLTGRVDSGMFNCIMAASDVFCSTTLSDAGPRTTYESAAAATPIISFDRSNASDFVNENNGALIETYDVKSMAQAMYRFLNYSHDEKKQASKNVFDDYEEHMKTEKLASKWQEFFDNH